MRPVHIIIKHSNQLFYSVEDGQVSTLGTADDKDDMTREGDTAAPPAPQNVTSMRSLCKEDDDELIIGPTGGK